MKYCFTRLLPRRGALPLGGVAAALTALLALPLPPALAQYRNPPASQEVLPEVEVVTGTIISGPKGILLKASDGDYLLKGQDLSGQTGKKLAVTGIVSEDEKAELVLTVKSFKPAK